MALLLSVGTSTLSLVLGFLNRIYYSREGENEIRDTVFSVWYRIRIGMIWLLTKGALFTLANTFSSLAKSSKSVLSISRDFKYWLSTSVSYLYQKNKRIDEGN